MKRLIFLVLFAALALPAAARPHHGVALVPTVGGRVLKHVVDGRLAYTYSWPGVYFEARFKGSAVSVRVNDDQNNLYLFVDGAHKLTLTRPGRTTVALTNLGRGPHTVRLEKASETQSSTGTFEGFTVASRRNALPPPHYDRSIEYIGDSFTVGYGDTSRGQTCTVDDVRDTTDTSLAFPPLVAKHFNAAYRIVASSGHGVVRNYAGMEPGNTMPALFQFTFFDKSVGLPEDGWSPDVVVIGLGTNDFSTPLAPWEQWQTREALRDDFVRTYVAFVQSLRAKWPGTHFILMASSGLYDNEIIDAVNKVADTLKAGGETGVEVIPFSDLDYMACHGHPSLKDEGILSRLLIDRISLLPKFAVPGAAPGS